MKIDLIKPYAFCPGVTNTIDKTLSIIRNNPNKKIYLIGNLVHNKIVCDQLLKFKNVKILDDKSKTRFELVKSIKTNNNILIFSAHGSDPKAIELAKAKGYEVYDLVCPFVNKIINQIQTKIKQGYLIAYYGLENHPEAIAAKCYGGKNLTIYQTSEDLKNVLKHKKVCVVCQTTMDHQAYLNTKKYFNKVEKLVFNDLICLSSKTRQANALNCKKYDIVFVVSDKTSHNGLSLYKVLKIKQKKVVLIDPSNYKITKKMLQGFETCAIFSSSSVSKIQVDNFIKDLKNKM